MVNEKFWNNEKSGLKSTTMQTTMDLTLSFTLTDEDKEALAQFMVDFIFKNRNDIRNECDKEDYRDDVIDALVEHLGVNDGEKLLAKVFPLRFINKIVADWQLKLGKDNIYWEQNWLNLGDALSDIVPAIYGNFNEEIVYMYLAYVKDTLSLNIHEDLMDIEDFETYEIINNINGKADYYRELALELKHNE